MIVSHTRCRARKIFFMGIAGKKWEKCLLKCFFIVRVVHSLGRNFPTNLNIAGHHIFSPWEMEGTKKMEISSSHSVRWCCCLSSLTRSTWEQKKKCDVGVNERLWVRKKVVLIIDVQTRGDKFLMTRLMYIAANWCLKRNFPPFSHSF